MPANAVHAPKTHEQFQTGQIHVCWFRRPHKTVVSFCTGGIRYEKATILMRKVGLEHVYQLDGGILKYFEETDGTHYHGGCFVFDARRAVDAQLLAMP